jgi:hypothetical protein
MIEDLTSEQAQNCKNVLGSPILGYKDRRFAAKRIEAHLDKHPDIVESCVVYRPGRGEITAFLVPVSPRAAAVDRSHRVRNLRRYLLKCGLPEYMVPRHYRIAEKLPRRRGHLDRARLAKFGAPKPAKPPKQAPLIWSPLSVFAFEGFLWDRIGYNGHGTQTFIVAHCRAGDSRTRVHLPVQFPKRLTAGLRLGLHVAVEGEIRGIPRRKPGALFRATSWTKTEQRTRIPLDRTDLLIGVLGANP